MREGRGWSMDLLGFKTNGDRGFQKLSGKGKKGAYCGKIRRTANGETRENEKPIGQER